MIVCIAEKPSVARDIAKVLGVSLDCIKEHLKLVFTRFNAATRTEAVAIAVARGFVRL